MLLMLVFQRKGIYYSLSLSLKGRGRDEGENTNLNRKKLMVNQLLPFWKLSSRSIINKLPYLLLISILLSSCVRIAEHAKPTEEEVEKRYGEAISILNDILDGRISGSNGNWNSAINKFKDIVKSYPNSKLADDAQFNVGFCYLWAHRIIKGSIEHSIKAFDYLMKEYPHSELIADAQYWKSYAYQIKGDIKRAIEEYEKFISKFPNHPLYEDAIYQITEIKKKNAVNIHPTHTERYQKGQDEDKTEQWAKTGQTSLSKVNDNTLTTKLNRTYEKVKKDLSVNEGRTYLTNIRFYSHGNYVRVVLDLTSSASYKHMLIKDPVRIVVDIDNALLKVSRPNIEIGDSVLRGIRTSQFSKDKVRVVIDINELKDFRVFSLKDPDRIVVDVYKLDKPFPKAYQRGEQDFLPSSSTLIRQFGLKVKTIVLDPGHGGKDPGAIGRSGLQEKFVTLDIAKRIGSKLMDKSYDVYLTREADVYVPLRERTRFANEKGADLFVSIHINSCKDSTLRGIETYFLSLASDEEARLTAALENSASDMSIKDLADLVTKVLKDTKVKESSNLAHVIQSKLVNIVGASSRGVKKAPFIVLIGSNCPSVLIELGFLSNEEDERLLLDEKYRDKLASAIAQAIEQYIKGLI